MKNHQKEFDTFCSESKLIEDARNAKYELLDDDSNIVKISGEIIGNDTLDRIRLIGNKYGLITLADGLSVMYRIPGPPGRHLQLSENLVTTEADSNHLRIGRKKRTALLSSEILSLNGRFPQIYELNDFAAWKVMKQLTKQTNTLSHPSPV